MLSRLSLRSKLLLVLFVPFLALVVVAAAGLSGRFTDLRAQEQYGELVAPLRSLDRLSAAIENESVTTSWYIASKGAPVSELTRSQDQTDVAVHDFRTNEQGFADGGVADATVRRLGTVNRGLDSLQDIRAKAALLVEAPGSARDAFLGVDDEVLGFGERVARDLKDADASASELRVFDLGHERLELAREAGTYVAVLSGAPQQDFNQWVTAIAAQGRYHQQFLDSATAAERHAFDAVLADAPDADLARPLDAAADLPSRFPTAAQAPAVYVDAYRQRASTLGAGIVAVEGVVRSVSSARAATARHEIWIYGGAAVAAMLVTLGLMWFVVGAVLRPLRRLGAAAREMSQQQLPQLVESLRAGGDMSMVEPRPISVVSEDEIGELARAFSDVEAVTVEVAREQARLLRKGMGDLFVNLARRNQSLLERQLELLDELERHEHDPEALGALFKLDHMATRMRRNAESLLVLSGAEQPRQWQQPVALLDVVRAAAAEIADFPRVELAGIDEDLAVAGRAVADVAHLLAELLENATSFSPPDSAVVVSGAATGAGFVLAVSDQGIGMPAQRIAEANDLLANPPVVGLALSRALGLHVVGLLAARHGISVELRAGAPLGLVALMTLPLGVLERRGEPIDGAEPAPTDHEEPSAPLTSRRVAWRPADEPPVEEWRREGLEPSTIVEGPVEVPRTVEPIPMPPAAEHEAQPAAEQPSGPSSTEVPSADDVPLPTRVPGHHLSHDPTAPAGGTEGEADPLRPYHVHELLTRHALGIRRGRADSDVDDAETDFRPEGER